MSEDGHHGENEKIGTDSVLTEPAQRDWALPILTHETLKYHLLGPSLTKAGQDSVDQQKVSEIIYQASKGSKYFNNEEVKDQNLTEKIERILKKKSELERINLSQDLRRADEFIEQLELSRDLSQYVIHVDCDAFYAAVEELDRPELKDVPFAVGKGVLTTCNYHARKFGCRSGMAGFVAKKLCPELISLPLNFEKYTAKAQEVRVILAEYDPRFESSSIDEAYLNISTYCEEHELGPDEVVAQMRREVHEKTKITVSAGIAANAKIAKICSNRNKPNGQFRIANERSVIMAFMRTLPTRKVNGIGRVWERELDAIGIKTCGDIYTHRAYLCRLFGQKAYEFLISVYLGLGKTEIRPAEEYVRKSVGTESTFHDMKEKHDLRAQLRHTAEELEKDSVRTQFKGRTLVLKIKLHTYEVFTRQTQPPYAVWKADDLYKFSEPLLARFEREIPGMTLRLMGLRLTHLLSTKKEGFDFFGLGKLATTDQTNTAKSEKAEWELWPEEEFERAARQERQDEMNEMEALSQAYEATQEASLQSPSRRHGKEILPNPVPASRAAHVSGSVEEIWACPICGRPQAAEDRSFNEHIDLCLSRQTISEAVRDTAEPATIARKSEVALAATTNKKRGRAMSKADPLRAQKKLFFC